MVSVGSKALPLRKHKARNLTEDCMMSGEDNLYNQGGKKRNMGRKAMKKHVGYDGDYSTGNLSGGAQNKTSKDKKFSKHDKESMPQTSFISKQVDPETAKYFSEISNVIEREEVDFEERSAICGNALEETRGKEVELATDYIISHTLQTLLDGCSVNDLCGFLRSCSTDFPRISMDKSGSHVAETALKSLAAHLQDYENLSLIEETLTKLCQAIVVNPVDVMCDCYGSHVLRSLLCLCKGVPLDSSEFHATKSSNILADRLNSRPSRMDKNDPQRFQQGFPDLLKFLVSEMLNAARKDIETLQFDQYGSLVIQTALKLLAGHEQELLHIIPILLGCQTENEAEGNFIEIRAVKNLLSLMKEPSYSHLMEVILEVVPETLYNELLTKVFKNSLLEMSSHPCGNFVVQALISHARCQGHMDLIWEELGTKFKDLLGMGKSGVVASLIATSQRLHSHEHKCCQALASAVCSTNESSGCIVPRILFLDNYFWCGDKSNWNWPIGAKMNVVGSLMLQAVFRLPSEFIQAYVTSITSLEPDRLLEASEDPRGARVIEAFLTSNASGKLKRKIVAKLRGHFGELAVHPSGSFTVDKCFDVSNVSMRETIVSELLAVQPTLSKTKQGPYLVRKLDVDGYSRNPDQWKSRQATKESTYKDFFDSFGPKETKSSKADTFIANPRSTSQPEKFKEMRKEIDTRIASTLAPSSGTPFLSHGGSANKSKTSAHKLPSERAERSSEKISKHATDDDVSKIKKKDKKKKDKSGSEKAMVSIDIVQHEKHSKSVDKKEKKRRKNDDGSKSKHKKMKT